MQVKEDILRLLTKPQTVASLAEATGRSKPEVSTYLGGLKERELVTNDDGTWRLTKGVRRTDVRDLAVLDVLKASNSHGLTREQLNAQVEGVTHGQVYTSLTRLIIRGLASQTREGLERPHRRAPVYSAVS